MTTNATGNATSGDNRSRMRGSGGDASGRGNDTPPRAPTCGSINCGTRKLLQSTEVSTSPVANLATTDGLATAANATMGAANATGMGAMNATMGAVNATNVTGNATDERSRRGNSCCEGAKPQPQNSGTEFGV